jgi:predicted permease
VANGAGLLLARTIRRRREIAVRLALGITRARLVRWIVAESLLLAALAGLAALALVPVLAALVRTTLLPDVAWTHPPVDGRVALVVAALTITAGLLAGLVPAVQAGRRDLTTPLHGSGVIGDRRLPRLRTVLAVAQATLSVVLLVGSGLFVRSFAAARTVDLGVEPYRVLVAGASWARASGGWSMQRMESNRRRERRFYDDALARARRIPGVEDAAIAVGTPFQMRFQVGLRVPGVATLPRLPGGGPFVQAVSPGYFRTVGLELLRGRRFHDGDRPDGERVAIVNQTMATTLWPGNDPLGRCLLVGPDDDAPCTRVVGVVEDGNRLALREERAMQYYLPFGQERGFGGTRLLVRPSGRPDRMIEPLRQALVPIDPTVLWIDVSPLDANLDPEIRPWRLGAVLMGTFGGLALLISAIGLYSLLAHMVAARMREMGIRTALGARRRQVLGLVLRYGLGVAGLGLALGLLLALLAGRAVEPLLFEVSPRDPLVYGGVVATLLAVALLACLTPGRRAAQVDPATILREE